MRKFDWRWLVLGVAVVGVVILAVVMNNRVEGDPVSQSLQGITIDNSDLKVNWERYKNVDIELTESLTITESGTYHLTGSLEEGQIIVDAGVGEVRLILDGVLITNSTGPAILAYNAENLVIELAGENVLADGANYDAGYDEDVDGVIYSKADLALTGEGSLEIRANHGDGIAGKDDVVIRGGDYNIIALDDGVRGKDSVYITNGKLVIDARNDAIKSTNITDFGKGFVLIEGGEIEISTLDKGLKSDRTVLVNGGTINVTKSYEGIEAQMITINDGVVNIVAMDDGMNTSSESNDTSGQTKGGWADADENCIITVNGGSVYINSAGDGIDSNGYLIFNGGETVVDGPVNNGNGALDAGLAITIQGGSVIAVGSSGMAESLGANSSVCNLSVYFDTTQPAGTLVEVRDADGEVILSHEAKKTFSHMAIGSKDLTLAGSYAIYLDGEMYQDFIITEVVTTIGNNTGMGPGGMPDDMPVDIPEDIPSDVPTSPNGTPSRR